MSQTPKADVVLTAEEHNREFTKFLNPKLFGLIAFIDRPSGYEHFPMASGVVIEAEGFYVLLTAAHYLEDVKRWKEEGRLNALVLVVHHESGICNPIPLNLDENFGSFCNGIDIGFVVLTDGVVAQINKHGGFLTRRDTLSASPEAMKSFYVVGLASAYCKLVTETIATNREVDWKISRLGNLAVVISKLEFDGRGSDPGTFRFALVNGFDDYSGASGGPVFGYADGSLIRDYSLFAIQSKQIRKGEQKPTHLIATSAAVGIHLIDKHLQELANSPDLGTGEGS